MALPPDPSSETLLPVAVVGVDFRRAPARQRDRLLLSADERLALADELRRSEIADGLACLDTCNRTEWIVSAAKPAWAAEVLRSQMIGRDTPTAGRDAPTAGRDTPAAGRDTPTAGRDAPTAGRDTPAAGRDTPAAGPEPGAATLVPYVRTGRDAALHLMEVAAGLESFVVGEHEIAGQLHRALERSRAEQTASPVLNGLGKAIGRLTRDTHRIQLTGAGPRGVHDVAVDYLLTHRPGATRVVVVGLGQIGEKVARALRGLGLRPVLCNRSPGVKWAGDSPVEPLDRLPALLGEAEGAVICTAAPTPVITEERVAGRQAPLPLLLVDLGIPAQVDPRIRPTLAECADLETIQQSAARRQIATWADLAHVRQRVDQAVTELEEFCRERNLTLLLRRTQERHQRYIQVEIPLLLDKALPEVEPGVRSRLESDLKGLVREYTNGVFGDIRDLLNSKVE